MSRGLCKAGPDGPQKRFRRPSVFPRDLPLKPCGCRAWCVPRSRRAAAPWSCAYSLNIAPPLPTDLDLRDAKALLDQLSA